MPIGAAPPSKAKTELSLKHIYAIAQVKMMDADLAAVGERAVVKQIIGTAKTLGLTVVA
jgi:ribosomal protein L11